MSEWILPKVEDIDTNLHGDEIHVYFESDENGSRYISIEGEALKHLKQILNGKDTHINQG